MTRHTVSISGASYQALNRYAAARGRSMSGIVEAYIDELTAVPQSINRAPSIFPVALPKPLPARPTPAVSPSVVASRPVARALPAPAVLAHAPALAAPAPSPSVPSSPPPAVLARPLSPLDRPAPAGALGRRPHVSAATERARQDASRVGVRTPPPEAFRPVERQAVRPVVSMEPRRPVMVLPPEKRGSAW